MTFPTSFSSSPVYMARTAKTHIGTPCQYIVLPLHVFKYVWTFGISSRGMCRQFVGELETVLTKAFLSGCSLKRRSRIQHANSLPPAMVVWFVWIATHLSTRTIFSLLVTPLTSPLQRVTNLNPDLPRTWDPWDTLAHWWLNADCADENSAAYIFYSFPYMDMQSPTGAPTKILPLQKDWTRRNSYLSSQIHIHRLHTSTIDLANEVTQPQVLLLWILRLYID